MNKSINKKNTNMMLEKNKGLARATAKGFTILEIIVVISIIGILATVLVSNLSMVAAKARDSVTKIEMDSLVKLATKYFDNNSKFYVDESQNFCDDPESQLIYSKMEKTVTEGFCHVAQTNTAWAVCAKLNIGSNQAWCVDNTGTKTQISMDSCIESILSCNSTTVGPTSVSSTEFGSSAPPTVPIPPP